MKYPTRLLLAAATLVAASSLNAAPINKAATGTELTDETSWTDNGAVLLPGTGDDAIWTVGSLMGAQTVGSAVNWRIISVASTAPASTPLSLSGSAITLSGATLNGSLTVVSNGSATSSLTIANDLILTGVNNNTATTIGEGGTGRLQLNAADGGLTVGKVTTNGGALANDANLWLRSSNAGRGTINGTLTVDGQLAKGDSGTWTLNGANTIGWVYANNGTLLAGHNQAFGAGTIYLTDNSNNSSPVIASKDATARTYANALNLTGGFTAAQSAVFGQTSGGTGAQTFEGGVDLGTAVRRITTNANTTFAGDVTGALGGITKLGAATLTLSGNNTYSGGTTLNGGTLVAGHNSAFGSGTVTVNGGTLDINSRTVSNAVKLDSGSLNVTSGSVGTLSNTVANTGTGNLNSGTNAATNFTVDGTGLKLTNLTGQGIFGGGLVTIVGSHTPGNSPGTQTFNSGLSYANNSSLTLEIAADGLTYDQIDITGGLTIGTNVALTLSLYGAADYASTFWDSNQSFTLISTDTRNLTDFATPTNNLAGDINEGTWTYGWVGNDFKATWTATAVPEPSAALLGGLGVLALLRRRRA